MDILWKKVAKLAVHVVSKYAKCSVLPFPMMAGRGFAPYYKLKMVQSNKKSTKFWIKTKISLAFLVGKRVFK
jgi:hypothetical protein